MTSVHPYLTFWLTVASSLGIGTFLGGILSYVLQRRTWLLDHKRLEWRELIDGLHECMEALRPALKWRENFDEGRVLGAARVPIVTAIVHGERLIADRIFIAESVRKNHVVERWRALSRTIDGINNEAELGEAGLAFINLWADLHDLLVQMARKDVAGWW